MHTPKEDTRMCFDPSPILSSPKRISGCAHFEPKINTLLFRGVLLVSYFSLSELRHHRQSQPNNEKKVLIEKWEGAPVTKAIPL